MSPFTTVEFYGVLPTLFSNKCKAYCGGFLKSLEEQTFEAQLREYPPDAVATQRRAIELFDRLVRDFPAGLRPSVVNPGSLRGLWLAGRHRLSNRLWLIINGRRVVDAFAEYTVIRDAVLEEHRRKVAPLPR